MNQQLHLWQSNEMEHRQNVRQQENRQHRNVRPELQQEIHSIRKEAAKIKQEHLKLKVQIEQRQTELQEYLRLQKARNENLLDIQVQNENMKVKMKYKDENLLKLLKRKSEAEEMCSTIHALCDHLSCVLIDIVQVKEEVVHYNDITLENIEKLQERFKYIAGKNELLNQNLKGIAFNEEERIKKEKEKKLSEIAEAKINLQAIGKQLDALCKKLNAKKEDTQLVEEAKTNMKNENENILEDLKKQIETEENQYGCMTNTSNLLMKQIEEMEINHKSIVGEINALESQVSKLKFGSTEVQLKSVVLNDELASKKSRYEEVRETALNMKDALEICESEFKVVKQHSEDQNSDLRIQKEELHNINYLIEEKKEQILKLECKLEEKVLHVEEQKIRTVREVEDLKTNIKIQETELSNSRIDLQGAMEMLATSEEQCKQLEDLEIQIQQESQQLQADHASNLEKLEGLNAALANETAEVERLSNLLLNRESEVRQFNEDLDKAQRKYDETVNLKEREKMEVDLEFKNAIREMEKSESNCHWIMQQTMACVDSCKQNYAKHVEDKKEELQACKSEKLHLVQKLSEVCAEKDERTALLENEVAQLEKTLKELEQNLAKERENNGSKTITTSPGALLKAQKQLLHPSSQEKFTYKEPKMSISSTGHPVVSPFADHCKKQAIKRKQPEVIPTFMSNPKVQQTEQNQETLSQSIKLPRKPEKSLKNNKFFKSKVLPSKEQKAYNIMEEFDSYKFHAKITKNCKLTAKL